MEIEAWVYNRLEIDYKRYLQKIENVDNTIDEKTPTDSKEKLLRDRERFQTWALVLKDQLNSAKVIQ